MRVGERNQGNQMLRGGRGPTQTAVEVILLVLSGRHWNGWVHQGILPRGSIEHGTFQRGQVEDGVWPLTGSRWVSEGTTWGGSATDKDLKGERRGRRGERGFRSAAIFSIGKCIIFRLKKTKQTQGQIRTSRGRFSLIKSNDLSCEKKPKVEWIVGTQGHYPGDCLTPQLIGCTSPNFPRCDLSP